MADVDVRAKEELRSDPPIQHRLVEVGGLRVHLRESPGDGPSVVLLPGGVLDSTALTWRYVLEALPRHYHAVVPDLPGYGRSAKPDVSYTTDYFIGFVRGLLDQLGLERVHLFGSSMSGATVLGFGLRHPERVQSLGLSGAFGWQPRVPFHQAVYALAQVPGWARLLRRLLSLSPAVVRAARHVSVHHENRITDALVRDSYEGARHPGAMEAFMRWLHSEVTPTGVRSNYASDLPHLPMPVLILHGAYDWTMPVRYARRAATRIPQAELHIFPEAGHLVPREFPEEVNRIVVEFLARVSD